MKITVPSGKKTVVETPRGTKVSVSGSRGTTVIKASKTTAVTNPAFAAAHKFANHQLEKNAPTPAPASTLKSLAKDIDEMWKLDVQITAKKDELKKLEEKYKGYENRLIEELPKNTLEGAMGRNALINLKRSPVPTVKPEDWPKLWAHVKKTGEFELIRKQLSVTACRERWDAGKEIPGVERFVKLSLELKERKK